MKDDSLKLFESKMKLYGDTNLSLSKALGITPQSFSMKKNRKNGLDFNRREIDIIRERYSLTAEDVMLIFFAKEVS